GWLPVGWPSDALEVSVWHTPQAASRTRTSPAFGSARSISWTTSGLPNSSRTAARIFMATRLSRLRSWLLQHGGDLGITAAACVLERGDAVPIGDQAVGVVVEQEPHD